MVSRYAGSAIVVVLALLAGCNREAQRQQSPEQLKGRLDAANGISNSAEKNAALKSVAEDAADSGVVDVVVKAVEGISNTTTRSEVAAACARKLAKRGDTKGATDVAQLISNTSMKNEVLGEIAKGN
jgi:hypothetical protein